MKTPLLIALTTALGLPLASAQEDRRPEVPRPPDAREQLERQREPADARPKSPRDRSPESAPRPGPERHDGPNLERPRYREERARDLGVSPRLQKPTAYLGVVTSPVAPAMASQLGLPEGFGLLVDEVLPDSPAARAGVQRFDVLKQLNDQQLVDPNQLAALVRSRGKDAEVTLTVLRKGEEQKLSVRLGERMLPERRAVSDDVIRGLRTLRDRGEDGARELQDRTGKMQLEYAEKMKEFNQRMEKLKQEHMERTKEFQERMKEYGDRMRQFQDRMEKWRQNPGADPQPQPPEPPKAPELPAPPKFPAPPVPPTADRAPEPFHLLREVRPGGAPGVVVHRDGGVTTWNTGQAHVLIKDEDGVVELRSENGSRSVTARNASGEVLHDGPIDTNEQRAALPEAVRRKLERIDAQSRVHAVPVPPPVRPPQSAPAREAIVVEAAPAPAPAPAEREIQ